MDPAQWRFIQQQRQRDEAFSFLAWPGLAWRDEQERRERLALEVAQEGVRKRQGFERHRELEAREARRRILLCGVVQQSSMSSASSGLDT